MQSILVPTDFSLTAMNAAEYATQLAKEMKVSVVLMHAYRLPINQQDFIRNDKNALKVRLKYEERLAIEADALMKRTGVMVRCITKMGFTVDQILAEEKDACIIVMGMSGAGNMQRTLMGSITVSTLRKAKKPVLVIPEYAKYGDWENVVLACDFDVNTNIRNAIEALNCFVKTFGSQINVVNIKTAKSTETCAFNILANGAELKHHGFEKYSVESEDSIDGINEFVNRHNADMLAIIPHRYKFLDRLFNKGTNKKLAFQSKVPLLALPQQFKTASPILKQLIGLNYGFSAS